MNILEIINGKKTYILASLGIIYACAGYFTGHIGSQEALGVIWASLTTMGLRHGISKV